jgi:hypothetical protein
MCDFFSREREHPVGRRLLAGRPSEAAMTGMGRVASWIPAFAGMTRGQLAQLFVRAPAPMP